MTGRKSAELFSFTAMIACHLYHTTDKLSLFYELITVTHSYSPAYIAHSKAKISLRSHFTRRWEQCMQTTIIKNHIVIATFYWFTVPLIPLATFSPYLLSIVACLSVKTELSAKMKGFQFIFVQHGQHRQQDWLNPLVQLHLQHAFSCHVKHESYEKATKDEANIF